MQGCEVGKMRRNLALLFSLVLGMLLVLSMTLPVQGSVHQTMWLQPAFVGFDSFYGSDVTAYTEGSTAMLGVTVDRTPLISQVNITAISVIFDWVGGNYTMTLPAPYVLGDTITEAGFTVTFTVPSVSVASNLFLHAYRVEVKYLTPSPGVFSTGSLDSFAVYSTAQAQAQASRQSASAYTQPTLGFSSSEANILWVKGQSELSKGNASYILGDFDGANTYYQNAINDFSEAYTVETAYSRDVRNAQTNALTAQSNYYNALANSTAKQADASMIQADAATTQADAAVRQADAALTNAYGWMAFGIGWILIGIGAIIYGLRRPKAPA